MKASSTTAISVTSSLIQIVETMQKLSEDYQASFVVKHQDNLIVAAEGIVSSTICKIDKWEVGLSSFAAVWSLQNPAKQFEALTTSAYEFISS